MKPVLALLAGLLLLSGCTESLPAADWCYQWDFTASNDHGFTQIYGNWTENLGLSPDSDGRFTIEYTHGQPVAPTGVIISAIRITNPRVPIRVVGRVNVFGIDTGYLETIVPADAIQRRFFLDGNGVSASPNLRIEGMVSGATVVLRYLTIRGTGSNPFGSTNCTTDALVLEDWQETTESSSDGLLDTLFTIPAGELVGTIQEADGIIESAGGSLTAPGGTPILLPETGMMLFGYAKWLFSPNAADEFGGPLGGVFSHLGIFVIGQVALLSVYSVVFLGTYIIRWVVWLIKFILQVVSTIAALLDSVIGKIAGVVVKFLGL